VWSKHYVPLIILCHFFLLMVQIICLIRFLSTRRILWAVYCVMQYILADTFVAKVQTCLLFTDSATAANCFLLLAGNNALNLVKLLATALIKLFSLFWLFISGAERRLETVHHSPPVPAAEQPQPRTVSDEEMCACLQRLDKLESLCNHLATKPPQIPEDKELMILNTFERIKSVEADLERSKRVSSYRELIYFVMEISNMHQHMHLVVFILTLFWPYRNSSHTDDGASKLKTLLISCQVLHTTMVKQKTLVETLESVQELSRVRVCHTLTGLNIFYIHSIVG
jgi:hypothetical protein